MNKDKRNLAQMNTQNADKTKKIGVHPRLSPVTMNIKTLAWTSDV